MKSHLENSGGNPVALCNGQLTTEAFFNEIEERILAKQAHLEPGPAYSVEDLVGVEYYAGLTDEQQATTEVSLATMVIDEMLPLSFTATRNQYRHSGSANAEESPESIRAIIKTFFGKLA